MAAYGWQVLPLIFANILTSVANLKTLPNAAQLGLRTCIYYMTTTVLAGLTGLVFTSIIILPNVGEIDERLLGASVVHAFAAKNSTLVAEPRTIVDQIEGIAFGLVPQNIVAEANGGGLLGVIMFAMIFGAAIKHPHNSHLYRLMDEVNEITSTIIMKLAWFTPGGVFFLVCPKVVTMHLGLVIENVGVLLVAIFTGLLFHAFVTYPLIYLALVRRTPFVFFRNILPAMFTALGTSSSAATLPVTLKCAIHNNNINPDTAKFVLSLGATVNMDGTAIGFPTVVIFLAKAQGITLGFGRMVEVILAAQSKPVTKTKVRLSRRK